MHDTLLNPLPRPIPHTIKPTRRGFLCARRSISAAALLVVAGCAVAPDCWTNGFCEQLPALPLLAAPFVNLRLVANRIEVCVIQFDRMPVQQLLTALATNRALR